MEMGGACKTTFWPKLGIWPNRLDPPSPYVGIFQKENKLMFIMHFSLFLAYYFILEKVPFLASQDALEVVLVSE